MVEACGEEMTDELISKYKQKLEEQLQLKAYAPSSQVFSREYKVFREEIIPPHMTIYENVCNFCEKVFKVKVKPELAVKIQANIDACHLQATPVGVFSASFLIPTFFIIISVLVSELFGSHFFALFGLIIGVAGIFIMQQIPLP